jgi:hypothetical protein
VTPEAPATAAEARAGRPSAWRPSLLAALAVVAAVAAWLLVQRGITLVEYPPFLPDGPPTQITRYSGPWLTAAGAAGLVAAVLLVLGTADVLKRRRRPPGTDRWIGPAPSAPDGPDDPSTPGTLAG